MRPITTWSIGVALVLHVGAAAAVSTISSGPPPREPTTITIRSAPPKKRPPPPPQIAPAAVPVPVAPTAPPPPKAPPRAAPAAAPKIAAAPPSPPAPSPAPTSGPPSYGVKMSNGTGAAIPSGGGGETAAPAPVHKTLGAEPATGCTDAPVKPKPINVVQPAFTPEAQEAGITGKVRVEITISKTGDVTGARVIEGLGYGLDEAALAAAKASTFSAATKCGEPVETTFTIGMRFQH